MPEAMSVFDMRLEDQLLLACSAANMKPAAISQVRDWLCADVEWNYLVSKAQQHAVLPLVTRNLQAHFRDLLPEAATSMLAGASWEGMRRNLALTGEMFRMLGLFAKAGIEVIPFKGPTLAVAAYGDLSLRMFADLDILVSEQDLDTAVKALVADGYALEYALTPKQDRLYRKTECALQLRNSGRNSVVELHWLLTERYLSIDLQIAGLWQRRTRTQIGQRAVMSLSPEDLFLYVCVHGSKHRWERLEWLCSVAAVAHSNPHMNWPAIADRARACGTERILHLALLLARNLLDMPLPEGLRADVEADTIAAHLAEETAVAFFSAHGQLHQDANRGEWYLYLVRIRERWRDKLRILVYSSLRLPHPTAHEIVRLPSKLDFLYYILRPARLVGATVWAAMRHTGERRRRPRNASENPVAETPVASFLSR
jgi:hypothetical protein